MEHHAIMTTYGMKIIGCNREVAMYTLWEMGMRLNTIMRWLPHRVTTVLRFHCILLSGLHSYIVGKYHNEHTYAHTLT